MDKIEKIRAEIERLKSKYRHNGLWSSPKQSLLAISKIEAMNELLLFLDTLEEEPAQNGYDEAYLNEKIAKASKTWEGVDVDKYMDEVRGREPDNEDLDDEISRTYHDGSVTDTSDLDHISYENIARHFAEWQYQKDRGEFAKIKAKTWCEGFDAYKQMFKDAVEGTVRIIRHNPPTVSVQIPVEDREGINISIGDKVRLVNVKED